MDTEQTPYPSPPQEPGRAPHAQPATPRQGDSTKATWFLLGAGAGCLGSLVLAGLIIVPALMFFRVRSSPSPMAPMVATPMASVSPIGPSGFAMAARGLPGTDDVREWEFASGPRGDAESYLFHEELQRFVFGNYGARAEGDLGTITKVRVDSDHPWPEPRGQVTFTLSAPDGREVVIAVDYEEAPGDTWQFALHEYKGP